MNKEDEIRKRFSLKSKIATDKLRLALSEYKLESSDELYEVLGMLYSIDSKLDIFLQDTVSSEYIENAFKEGIKKGIMQELKINMSGVIIDYDKLALAIVDENDKRSGTKEENTHNKKDTSVSQWEFFKKVKNKIIEPKYLIPSTIIATILIMLIFK